MRFKSLVGANYELMMPWMLENMTKASSQAQILVDLPTKFGPIVNLNHTGSKYTEETDSPVIIFSDIDVIQLQESPGQVSKNSELEKIPCQSNVVSIEKRKKTNSIATLISLAQW